MNKDCRKIFLKFFPKGFKDKKYYDWERDYKWNAHEQWEKLLNPSIFKKLLEDGEYLEIASRALKIESKTNLLFSFEKMALRDGIKSIEGARTFAEGLYKFLYGRGKLENKFYQWCKVIESLPRKQTRVLTWPVVTVFGFIARPDIHIFLKPKTTRNAASQYGFDFKYHSRPSWETYSNLLELAKTIKYDQKDLHPQDMIDLQSFIWVIGSDEYANMA